MALALSGMEIKREGDIDATVALISRLRNWRSDQSEAAMERLTQEAADIIERTHRLSQLIRGR